MENLFYHFSQVLGITIIHSMWQGLIVYMLLRMYLQCFTASSASTRYRIAFAALGITAVWFIYTLLNEISRYNWNPQTAFPTHVPLTLPNVVHELTAPDSRYSFAFAGYMPYVTMLYLAGLVFNILKMLLAWNNIYRIRQNTIAAGFEDQANKLSAKLGLRKRVEVAFSEWVDVPCITGFIKPVILLPFTIGNYLNADEIAAILLHEMAHIKRNDYLMNLIQQVIQILLFFNPFARLIGKVINQERENCCDDAVVKITGTPLIYAQALLKLEENKQPQWHLALAATGKKYHLLNRIERIMKTKKHNINIRPVLIALVLLTFSLSSLAWFNPKIENGKLTVKTLAMKPLLHEFFADTTKKPVKTKASKPKPKAKGRLTNIKRDVTINMNDPKLDDLSAEVNKHAEAIQRYYELPEFKKLQDDMEKNGAAYEDFANSEQAKRLEKKLEEMGKSMEKIQGNPEMLQLQKQIEEYGQKVGKYYDNPDFQKLNDRIGNLGQQLGNLKYGTPQYSAKLKELQKLSKQVAEYSQSAAMQATQKQLAQASKKMAEYYNNDHYKSVQQSMRVYSDSIRKMYDTPEWRKKQDELRQMGKAMADYQKRPEVAREMQALKEAQRKLTDYMKTPEFKQKMKLQGLNMELKDAIRREVQEAREKAEQKEKSEKPEQSEKPEATEKPETPPAVVKPDSPLSVVKQDKPLFVIKPDASPAVVKADSPLATVKPDKPW